MSCRSINCRSLKSYNSLANVINFFSLSLVGGNFDIHADRKILFMNETKWYKIWPRPERLSFKKIFQTLQPNFVKGLNKSKVRDSYALGNKATAFVAS